MEPPNISSSSVQKQMSKYIFVPRSQVGDSEINATSKLLGTKCHPVGLGAAGNLHLLGVFQRLLGFNRFGDMVHSCVVALLLHPLKTGKCPDSCGEKQSSLHGVSEWGRLRMKTGP